jgi:hypothetical protein
MIRRVLPRGPLSPEQDRSCHPAPDRRPATLADLPPKKIGCARLPEGHNITKKLTHKTTHKKHGVTFLPTIKKSCWMIAMQDEMFKR